MTGIIVGVDGSGDSHRALEWAMNEAAIRHAPLTVVTVAQAVAGFWGVAYYRQYQAMAEQAQLAAEEAAENAQAKLGDPGPASTTVRTLAEYQPRRSFALRGTQT